MDEDRPSVIVFDDGSYDVVPEEQAGEVTAALEGDVGVVNWRGLAWTVPTSPGSGGISPRGGWAAQEWPIPPVVEQAEEKATGARKRSSTKRD